MAWAMLLLASCVFPGSVPTHSHTPAELAVFEPPTPFHSRARWWLDHLENDLFSLDPAEGAIVVAFSSSPPGQLRSITLMTRAWSEGDKRAVTATVRHSVCTQREIRGFGLHREARETSGRLLSEELMLSHVTSVSLFRPAPDGPWIPIDKDQRFDRRGGTVPAKIRIDLTFSPAVGETRLVRKELFVP